MTTYYTGPTGPAAARTRYLIRLEAPRLRGWVELESHSRASARAEALQAFGSRGYVLTLWERDSEGPGYFRVGVIAAPASVVTVDVT